ncbi:MAG TPA: hypothetical protein VFO77_08585 [Actinoplanes sp.]|nr:hypothetical protein [Actinoplanes sp.]
MASTSLAEREPTEPQPTAPVSFRAVERWVMLVTSAWLVGGLQLDAYAHATIPELETFWTPWHAVLYSGMAASGLTLLWLLRSRLPSIPTYGTLLALPNALRVPMLGMALLLVGGGVDTLWHNLFGIETDLEIFVSPSHALIILGMVLVAAGPALMVPAGRLTVADGVLATISALLAMLPLHIYSLHASVLATDPLGYGGDRIGVYSYDAQLMHGYLFTTVLLLLPIVLLSRRWRVPIGVPTVLVAAPTTAMHLMFLTGDPWWPALTIVAAAAAAELVLRVAAAAVQLPREVGWAAVGLFSPVVLWGGVFLVGQRTAGIVWNVHMVTGLLMLTALAGVATALVIRHIRVGPPDAAR